MTKTLALILGITVLGGFILARAGLAADLDLDFSPTERTQFVDSVGTTSVRTISNGLVPHAFMYWLDNDHVIMSVRQGPDVYGAKTGSEDGKVVILDTNTGQVQDTSYRGGVICFANGTIAISGQVTDGLVIGTWGQNSFLPLALPKNTWPWTALSGVDCQPRDFFDGHTAYRLNPGDGTLYSYPPNIDPETSSTLVLLDEAGVQKWKKKRGPAPGPLALDFVYLPFLSAYSMAGTTGQSPGQLLGKDGQLTDIPKSTFLSSLDAKNEGSGRVKIGRTGPVWFFRPWPSYWKKQGVYVDLDGTLYRVDDRGWLKDAGFSPDGCKILYTRQSGKINGPPPRSDGFDVAILNVCTFKIHPK